MLKYKFDLVGVQEVRWKGGATEPVEEYTFFYRKGNETFETFINHSIDPCMGRFTHWM
jgi:hypothetical protein